MPDTRLQTAGKLASLLSKAEALVNNAPSDFGPLIFMEGHYRPEEQTAGGLFIFNDEVDPPDSSAVYVLVVPRF